MFWHIYKYRFKSMIRSKEEIFWLAIFPILMCTCFAAALSAINDKEFIFHSIPVAVVYEKENETFSQVLNETASDDSQGDAFLILTEADEAHAKELLSDKKVDAVITVNDTISLTVKEEGINQTAVQSFLSQYLQQESMIKNIASNHPDKLETVLEKLSDSTQYINEKSLIDKEVDSMASYYYALIAMTLLYGGFLGLKCARQLKADTSSEGLRKCIAPVNRAKLIFTEFLALFTIHLLVIIILLFYIIFVLRVNIGSQIGYISLTCALGSMVGILSGLFVGSIPKLKEALQIGIFLTYSLLGAFLAGLMSTYIKIGIQHNAPIVNKINPAALISDALYSLLVYNTHERYFENMALLSVWAIVLFVLSYIMTRRKTYASL